MIEISKGSSHSVEAPEPTEIATDGPAMPAVFTDPPLMPDVVTVPASGLPGQNGEDGADLSPEDLDELTRDVTGTISDQLVPPVDLVILFENGLA